MMRRCAKARALEASLWRLRSGSALYTAMHRSKWLRCLFGWFRRGLVAAAEKGENAQTARLSSKLAIAEQAQLNRCVLRASEDTAVLFVFHTWKLISPIFVSSFFLKKNAFFEILLSRYRCPKLFWVAWSIDAAPFWGMPESVLHCK